MPRRPPPPRPDRRRRHHLPGSPPPPVPPRLRHAPRPKSMRVPRQARPAPMRPNQVHASRRRSQSAPGMVDTLLMAAPPSPLLRPSGPRILVLRLLRARGLAAKGQSGKTSNPHCWVRCRGQAVRTPTLQRTLNPEFHKKFVFRLDSFGEGIQREAPESVDLQGLEHAEAAAHWPWCCVVDVFHTRAGGLRAWLHGGGRDERFLGRVHLPLAPLLSRLGETVVSWLPLGKRSERSHVDGEIQVEAVCMRARAADYTQGVHYGAPGDVHKTDTMFIREIAAQKLRAGKITRDEYDQIMITAAKAATFEASFEAPVTDGPRPVSLAAAQQGSGSDANVVEARGSGELPDRVAQALGKHASLKLGEAEGDAALGRQSFSLVAIVDRMMALMRRLSEASAGKLRIVAPGYAAGLPAAPKGVTTLTAIPPAETEQALVLAENVRVLVTVADSAFCRVGAAMDREMLPVAGDLLLTDWRLIFVPRVAALSSTSVSNSSSSSSGGGGRGRRRSPRNKKTRRPQTPTSTSVAAAAKMKLAKGLISEEEFKHIVRELERPELRAVSPSASSSSSPTVARERGRSMLPQLGDRAILSVPLGLVKQIALRRLGSDGDAGLGFGGIAGIGDAAEQKISAKLWSFRGVETLDVHLRDARRLVFASRTAKPSVSRHGRAARAHLRATAAAAALHCIHALVHARLLDAPSVLRTQHARTRIQAASAPQLRVLPPAWARQFRSGSSANGTDVIVKDARRLGIPDTAWRVTQINKDFGVCSTYPRALVVPRGVDDATLVKAAKFRSRGRLPAISWRSTSSSAVIARCSQPMAGIGLRNRSEYDETLLEGIRVATPGGFERLLVIIDARPKLSAIANQAKGKGYEDISVHYTNCEIEFMNIDNIHVMRKSLLALFKASGASSGTGYATEQENIDVEWKTDDIDSAGLDDSVHGGSLSKRGDPAAMAAVGGRGGVPLRLELEGGASGDRAAAAEAAGAATGGGGGGEQAKHLDLRLMVKNKSISWIGHVSRVLAAAVRIAKLNVGGTSTLVHCSDGWDRTAQLTALAQLLLDPFYRTFAGFAVLVEKEWVAFGHKFADRHGMGDSEEPHEVSPVFLQFCDCVHQLGAMFPSALEFNSAYLAALTTHAYSGFFGTLLGDNERQRAELGLDSPEATFSFWDYADANKPRFANTMYAPINRVLIPHHIPDQLCIWSEFFLQHHRWVPQQHRLAFDDVYGVTRHPEARIL